MSEREPTWAKKPPQKCGTCKWLRPYSEGTRFHHSNSYPCTYEIPSITWPESMPAGAYNSPRDVIDRPIKGYMRPGEGKDCPCWERKALAP